jgi:hypothetical protein
MQRQHPRPPCFLFRCCSRQANPLVVVDELVCELAKEFEATYLLVVRMDDLLGKKVGIDTDDAEDSEVEPLVPMSGGKIVVHPQLIGADPVVPVDGAGTLVICRNRLRLGDLNNDSVRWRTPDLSSWRRRLRKTSSPSPILHVAVSKNRRFLSTQLMASSVSPVSSSIEARTARDPHRGRVVFPRNSIGNRLLHCFMLPMKVRPFSFIANAASVEAK